MPLLDQKVQDMLRDMFAKNLPREVQLTLFTQHESPLTVPGQECMYCKETRELLEEVTALSDKLKLTVHDFVAEPAAVQAFGVDKIPAVIVGDGAIKGVRYFGIPGGYEFSAFVEDIIDVSRDDTDLAPDVKTELNNIDQDVHIQVFVTPT